MANIRKSINVQSPFLAKSVIYGLNKSFGKIILAGLELNSVQFTPVVKVLSNTFAGPSLNAEDWKAFKSDFACAKRYFNATTAESDKMCNTRIEHRAHYTLLTTCYMQKSVCFGTINDNSESCKHEEEAGEPSAKRFRRYSPNIILQRPTFEKLVEISTCIDMYLQQLEKNKAVLQQCLDEVVSHARDTMLERDITTAALRDIIVSKDFLEKVFEHTKTKLETSEIHREFIENSLKPSLFEIIALYSDHIVTYVSQVATQSQ